MVESSAQSHPRIHYATTRDGERRRLQPSPLPLTSTVPRSSVAGLSSAPALSFLPPSTSCATASHVGVQVDDEIVKTKIWDKLAKMDKKYEIAHEEQKRRNVCNRRGHKEALEALNLIHSGVGGDWEAPIRVKEEEMLLAQDPAEADKLLKIQRDLDETKIILCPHQSEAVAKETYLPFPRSTRGLEGLRRIAIASFHARHLFDETPVGAISSFYAC
uniref:Uncharacterized protein n=1 Tax=Oryza punctata TaxID=4537 RepID=A0A0E0M572_ORYPU